MEATKIYETICGIYDHSATFLRYAAIPTIIYVGLNTAQIPGVPPPTLFDVFIPSAA